MRITSQELGTGEAALVNQVRREAEPKSFVVGLGGQVQLVQL